VAEEEGKAAGIPQAFTLLQNHPNPFNSSTLISYTLPEPARVRLQVYNLLGQQVATLAEGYQQAGSYQVRWDGKDKHGHPVPSGVYLYRLQAGELKQTRRMTVLR